VTRLCPSPVAGPLWGTDNWHLQGADLRKLESRRADSNREPPDYKRCSAEARTRRLSANAQVSDPAGSVWTAAIRSGLWSVCGPRGPVRGPRLTSAP
jgi:hypothetical protein